jgi:hypothetical protein
MPMASLPRARAARPPADPARDAAGLLRRLGFLILLVVVPVAALVARRAVVILAPIALVLLVLAAALDGQHRALRPVLARFAGARMALSGLLAVGWCALSIAWTPFPGPAAERLANVLAAVALTLAGYLALPDRMRSANLYLIPIGVAAAAMTAVLVGLFGGAALRAGLEDDGAFERGLTLLALLAWPAIAWLRSRGRDLESLGLAVLVALALVLAPRATPLLAMALGATAFAATAWRPRIGVAATAWAAAGILALAPLLPFVLQPIARAMVGPLHPLAQSLGAWRRVVTSEPLRLITGHGFETALRSRLIGMIPGNAPASLPFELWYELGIVGALGTAAALALAVRAAGRDGTALVPGAMAAFATAFAIACLGVGMTVMWWFTSLAMLVLVFVTVERGQFRTQRPKAGGPPPAARPEPQSGSPAITPLRTRKQP